MSIGQKKCVIIAEAGINHNGSLSLAKELVIKAQSAGADYIKFQTFLTDSLVTKAAEKAAYQKKNDVENSSMHSMLQKFELSFSEHTELSNFCAEIGIKYLSSPFDLQSVKFVASLKVDAIKVPSGEITNVPYLREVGGSGLPIILSTGMATLEEIRFALNVLIKNGSSLDYISILHCTTEYPTPMDEVNLLAMITIGREFGVSVGYSDHTMGLEVSFAAVALGARVIEKHFTLDNALPGPDHAASIEYDELVKLVSGIRNIEKCLGDGVKRPTISEVNNSILVRKGIFAKKDIKKGEILSEENLITKRPASGLSARYWDEVIGKTAKRHYSVDEAIEL